MGSLGSIGCGHAGLLEARSEGKKRMGVGVSYAISYASVCFAMWDVGLVMSSLM